MANRILIALIGLVAIAFGLALELPHFAPLMGLRVPVVHAPSTVGLSVGVGACAVIVVLALIWIFTRGRGRTAQLVVLGGEAGSITIDTRLAADLISDALAGNRDIVSVGSGAYLMRGERVLSLRVVARRGADLPALIASVGDAIGSLDVVLERQVPVLLQVVSGFTAGSVRTH